MRSQKLNPFLREAYLIKYSEKDAASIVTGKDVFTQRAAAHPNCDGWKYGVIILDSDGKIVEREGALVVKELNETLIGGWAEAWRKDWKIPAKRTVSFDEYAKRNREGELNRTWKGMPGTMIAKVALVQLLRDVFSESLAGMYSVEEIQSVNEDDLKHEVIDQSSVEAEATESEGVQESGEQPEQVQPAAEPKATNKVTKADPLVKNSIADRIGGLYEAMKESHISETVFKAFLKDSPVYSPFVLPNGALDFKSLPLELYNSLLEIVTNGAVG